MERRVQLVAAGALAAIIGGLGQGCGPDDTSCDAVEGQFAANYAYIDGDCQNFLPFNVSIPAGVNGLSNTSVNANGSTIITEVNAKGCTLDFVQESYRNQQLLWAVRGEMDVIASDELHGRAWRMEYMIDDSVACQGTFDLTLTQGWEQSTGGMTISR